MAAADPRELACRLYSVMLNGVKDLCKRDGRSSGRDTVVTLSESEGSLSSGRHNAF